MPRIWTVIANSNVCRIYEYNKAQKELHLVTELDHPQSRLKGHDLITDKPGRYQQPRSARSAYEPNMDPQQIEVARFAHQIAAELEAGKNDNRYQDLVFIIPAQMSGIINKLISKEVKNSIIENIHKDYLQLSEPEILDTLNEALRRPKL
jgi:protein required for attachment to host cells